MYITCYLQGFSTFFEYTGGLFNFGWLLAYSMAPYWLYYY